MEEREEMLNKSKVREMGFSESMIRDLLPKPIEKANPIYRCAAAMKLWPKTAVEKAMRTDEFAVRKSRYDKRKEAASKSTSAKLHTSIV